MAQHVGYFENNIQFSEGPFVVCKLMESGYRIEVENPESRKGCPCLPDSSIYGFAGTNNLPMVSNRLKDIEETCDILNKMVQLNMIQNLSNWWVYVQSSPGKETACQS